MVRISAESQEPHYFKQICNYWMIQNFQRWALSVSSYYRYLTSCKKLESFDRFSRKSGNEGLTNMGDRGGGSTFGFDTIKLAVLMENGQNFGKGPTNPPRSTTIEKFA